jgi:hypothetical protein
MNGPTKQETLLGETEIKVDRLDGLHAIAKIQQLPLAKMAELAAALSDEVAMVKLFSGLDANELTRESAEAIVVEGERINMDFFERWDTRRKSRSAMIPKQSPEDIAALITALAKTNPDLVKAAFAGSLSPTSSRTSALGVESP